MIVSIRGTLVEKHPHKIVVECSGIGYEVGISANTYSLMPSIGSETSVHIYHHITESEQRLFGFTSVGDKALFEQLITVKGIGPRLALTIMSGIQTADLVQAINRQDTGMLSRTPGIGKKTAERVVLELRDKVGSTSTAVVMPTGEKLIKNPSDESVSALEALGFKRNDAQQAVDKTLQEQPNITETGDLVRAALKLLYR